MSIAIKGMDMPTSCSRCPCSNDASRFCRVVEEYIPMLGKPAFCPLVDVPDTNVGDMISRQAAIDALGEGREMLSRVLDDTDVVGNEREKFEWGLGLIESYINDMIELPSAQHKPSKYTGDSICLYCQTADCEGCMYEPVEGVQ